MGIEILELIAEQGLLSDHCIATELSYNLVIVRHILSSYFNFGYLIRDERERYDLSTKIFEIGRKFKQRSDIKAIARPYMQRIVHKYNETIVLGMLEGTKVLSLDKIDSLEMLRFVPQSEQKITAHHTALGKSILAYLPPDKLKHYCMNAPLEHFTPKSIVSIDTLLVGLSQIQKQGFAISDEEYCTGLREIAVPILDQMGVPRFSISLWGPLSRMMPGVLREMQKDLSDACREISKYYTTSFEKSDDINYAALALLPPQNMEKSQKTGILKRIFSIFL